ncbi:laccase [Suillus spraguei]|nr:laccase [Suillus spraguei]
MFTSILFASFISLINAAAIVSRSQSYPLPQNGALGPQSKLTIGNKVISPAGYERSATLVNGVFPGPLIMAQKGDNFSIEVANELTDTSMYMVTSVHFHGIYQNRTNYADGTVSVTQCPVAPNNSYVHTFSAEGQAGTFWYHSHYSVQYCDGLRGAMVIYDPEDPLGYLYDVDDGNEADSTLINGLGRYAGGPASDLAVINVEQGKRYRFRLLGISCDSNFQFSIDGHSMTVIEADGQSTEPLVVDQLQILAGQRYSVVVAADQPVNNYWVRSLPDTTNASFVGGTNSAILRYQGAQQVEPTTVNTTSTNPLQETNLHALVNPAAPGIPEYGAADINLNLQVANINGIFFVNNVSFAPPHSQQATDLMPNVSVIVLEANKVVELTLSTTGPGGPHPIHLHGHSFSVVQSAGNSTFNYANPVRRDVVSAGSEGQQMVIRWVTDNSGPWFLHCHINWHLDSGFAVVMAESPSITQTTMNISPPGWDELCPAYNALTPEQLGGGGLANYEAAADISSILYPPPTLPGSL